MAKSRVIVSMDFNFEQSNFVYKVHSSSIGSGSSLIFLRTSYAYSTRCSILRFLLSSFLFTSFLVFILVGFLKMPESIESVLLEDSLS